MPGFPDFQKLWDAYPNEEPAALGVLIGGAIQSGIGEPDATGQLHGWIRNTCTIRLSRAFNGAGEEWQIPNGHEFKEQKTPRTLATASGADKQRYAFRVAEFVKYLRERFGEPPVKVRKVRGDATVPAAFKGRKGIIVFKDCGWSDATGHVDLWDGAACRHKAYWSEAKEVSLWTPDGTFAVKSAHRGELMSGGTPIVTIGRFLSHAAGAVAAGSSSAASKVASKAEELTSDEFWTAMRKHHRLDPSMAKYAPGLFVELKPGQSFDWTTAYLMAMACKASYRERTIAAEVLPDMGLPTVTWINEENVEAFVASDERRVVLAFRGTEFASFKDLYTDASIDKVPEAGGKVHQGTHRAVSMVWSQVQEALKQHDPLSKKPLWVTGHSLGGAMAVLASQRLIAAKHALQPIYTFGQLMVGDRAFVDGLRGHIYRVTNENDPVPYCPPPFNPAERKSHAYQHGGRLQFLNTHGHHEPSRTSLPGSSTDVKWLHKLVTADASRHSIDTYLEVGHELLPASLKTKWPKPS